MNFLAALIVASTALAGSGSDTFAQRYGANNERMYQMYQRNYQRGFNTFTGTWRLEATRGDNLNDAVDRATRELQPSERERIRDQVMRRLDSPEIIAIDQRGRRFTIASSHGPQFTFDADGRTHTETLGQGRSVQVNASFTRDQLVVSATGSRGSDYQVTFDPTENGQRMRVTRRIYSERLSQPVTVSSIYEKTSDIAQLNINQNDNGYRRRDESDNGYGRRDRSRFIVPDGVRLTTELDADLSTKNLNSGDRFNLIVRSPSQYSGAVIEGVVADLDRSGRVSGRAKMSLDFERIRYRDGSTYEFQGYIEDIRTPNGENIRVDNEGTVREDNSQTSRTVTRSGIGAAVGAIVGALAGGGKGAAIGAAVGAGAGAGSVLIQGRDDLDLPRGTEFNIRSVSPRSGEARR